MRTLFLLISLVIIPLLTRAQANFTEEMEKECGTSEHHTYLMNTDPDYKARFLHQKAILDSVKYAPMAENRQHPPIYTIPIVVHVIHLGEQVGYRSNIPDQQILDAIEGLNERYANINGVGTDIEINFCLANRDPNGCPTSGINRVDGSIIPGYRENGITWDGFCGVDETAVKDLSKWPTGQYYNIWVVNDICGNVAGYAYYPNGGEYDGTVIDVVSMVYDRGVLAHEVGHGLNLKHTFEGNDNSMCPVNDNCMEDGDEICDTPPHRTNDCGNTNPCSTEGIWLNSKNNWMSYCSPTFDVGLFTEDQRTRMRNALSVEPRAALMSSQACTNEVNMQFTSDGSMLCPFKSRVLTAIPEGGFFMIASGSGYIQGNVLTATGGTNIVVEYVVVQEDCTSSVYQDIPISPAPHLRLEIEEDTLCVGQATTFKGFPTGGIYELISGPGVIDSNLLIAEDSGSISLYYEKIYAGCVIRDTQVVESYPLPNVDIQLLTTDVLTAVPGVGFFQWLRCDADFEPIPGATGALLHVPSSGSYAVVAINGICRDTSDCVEVVFTRTEDKNADDIRFYPNPVKDVLYLEGYQKQDVIDINLFNLEGKRIYSKIIHGIDKAEMDLSSFHSGVYMVEVKVKGVRRSVYRVVKL